MQSHMIVGSTTCLSTHQQKFITRSITMFTVNKTHISDTTQCNARQWKACPSEHLPVRFARLPLILIGICDRQLGEIVLCPNQGHTRWPGAIHPQLDCTSQCRQPSPPANRRRFDSPLRPKPRSQSLSYCASTTPFRHTPPLRTRFPQEAKIDSLSRRCNRRRCRHSNPGPRPRRSPQPLWIHLASIAVASVCCHCEGVHSWEARASSFVQSGPR